jgi:hypothetical protein
MARDNTLLYVIIGILVVFALYYVMRKSSPPEDSVSSSGPKGERPEPKSNPPNSSGRSVSAKPPSASRPQPAPVPPNYSRPDIEFVDHGDDEPPPDAFELLGVAPEQPAYNLSVGMGPGVYMGPSRHTSEMVGN